MNEQKTFQSLPVKNLLFPVEDEAGIREAVMRYTSLSRIRELLDQHLSVGC